MRCGEGDTVKWHWNEDDLAARWSLSAAELALLPGRTDHGRLGCAILLKYFQCQGCFPSNRRAIPDEVVAYVARATGTTAQDLEDDDWDGRTGRRHRKRVLAFAGLRSASPEDLQHLRTWLIDEIIPSDWQADQIREFAIEWFARQSLAPIASEHLKRLIRSAIGGFETGLCQRIAGLLTSETKASIDALLLVEDDTSHRDESSAPLVAAGETDCGLLHLKADPGRIGLESVLRELGKLSRIRQLALPTAALAALPRKWRQK